jgi:hypothetical protein
LTGKPYFGAAYDPQQDEPRLTIQRDRICALMLELSDADEDHWYSVTEIEPLLKARGFEYLQTSISAQLRNLRKKECGSFRVDSRRRAEGGGTFEYRVRRPLPRAEPQQLALMDVSEAPHHA